MSKALYKKNPCVLMACMAIALTACGGGGGGSAAPAEAPTTLAAALPDGDHVVFTVTALELSEAARSARLTVARTGNGTGETRVHYSVASASAVAGSDFLDASGELVWADGELGERTVQVTVLSDLDRETDETFSINLDSISGNDTLGINDSVQVTLTDSPCDASLPTTISGSTDLTAACYHASSSVSVEGGASLNLAPGTTVIADAGVSIAIRDSASINAAGNDTMPVSFVGANSEAGYWRGIQLLSSNVMQQFSHVSISDAVVGIDVVEGSALGQLDSLNVRQVETAGVRIPAAMAEDLIDVIDFDDESGGIALVANRITPDAPLHLPDLGSHYVIENSLIVDGDVSLAPGVDMLMGRDTQILVSNRGSLNLEGTASLPITLTGKEPSAGFWNGVLFSSSTSTMNQFNYVTLSHGGGDLTRDGNINIISADTRLNIENSVISNSAGYGVWVDNTVPGLTLTETILSDNVLGDFRPN